MILSNVADLQAQVARWWARGLCLDALFEPNAIFPKRLVFKSPSQAEMVNHFAAVRQWVGEMQALPHYRLDYQSIQHRQLGDNLIPVAAWVDSLEAATQLLGKQAEVAQFKQLQSSTLPMLEHWLKAHPMRALQHAEQWARLQQVVAWFIAHPRPNCYLRQIDLPSVDSKFIEQHQGILSALLDACLPSQQINRAAHSFAVRYGCKDKPLRIRYRDLSLEPIPDITLDVMSFAKLQPDIDTVIISENEINFLSLPALPRSLAIFGAGYGWEALAQAQWLQRTQLIYWGDIDTHGLAILDQLRAHFPQTESLMMDRATLLKHQTQWGSEPKPVSRDLSRLREAERLLYDDLVANRLGNHIRLEQERIGFDWVLGELSKMV
jgi:hypothetical protein